MSSPFESVLHDGVLIWVMVVIGGLLPVVFYTYFTNILDFLKFVTLLTTNVYWFLTYCTKNNVEHLIEQTNHCNTLLLSNPEKYNSIFDQHHALSMHLRFQNKLAFFTLLLYSLIPLIFAFIEYMITLLQQTISASNENNDYDVESTGIIKSFLNEYMPRSEIADKTDSILAQKTSQSI